MHLLCSWLQLGLQGHMLHLPHCWLQLSVMAQDNWMLASFVNSCHQACLTINASGTMPIPSSIPACHVPVRAFAAVGSMEASWFISTGTPRSFSEQQLIDCSWDEGTHGCDGGDAVNGFE